MDQSLYPGNYFDYADDDVAIQRESEMAEDAGDFFIDDVFPPNARSLYLDPLNPPKGSIPNESIKWFRICDGDLEDCTTPVICANDISSCEISQGALGNTYFVNALSLLAAQTKFINRLIVSTKFASRGLYTLKFYKTGRWRYVHIDDHIPCRQSGKVHYTRNANPNELFAMLIEKAYAKLHGCYEAVSCGLIEKLLQELTPAAGVQTFRIEKMSKNTLCDELWEAMEKAKEKGYLVGCGRFVADPFADSPTLRQGIDLGHLYQVYDVMVANAEPTEDFDSLTIGMVCVRNLQKKTGRYTGKWSYGDQLWIDYKEIAKTLKRRTQEIQFERGLGPEPDQEIDTKLANTYSMKASKSYINEDRLKGDEPDGLGTEYIAKKKNTEVEQPEADDLYWMQIEDFVKIFNRIYIVSDLSFDKRCGLKRWVSKWIPGDYLVGSGGPPIIITKELIQPDEEDEEEEEEDEEGGDGSVEKKPKEQKLPYWEKIASVNENFTDNPMFPFTVTEPSTMTITLYQQDRRWNMSRLADPTGNAYTVPVKTYQNRITRLQQVMQYSKGIAFLVVRLSGSKIRLTEFRLKKVAYTSENVLFANATCCTIPHLFPGRYAIIPYTHTALDRGYEYALHCQFIKGQVEFEIEDPIAERLQDREPSEEGLEEEFEPEDNDLLEVNEETEEITILTYEKIPSQPAHILRKRLKERFGGEEDDDDEDEEEAAKKQQPKFDFDEEENPRGVTIRFVPLPKILTYTPWEYAEDLEESSLSYLFDEVGDMMKYLKNVKQEVRKLHATVKAITQGGDNADNALTSTKGGNIDGNSRRYGASKRS